MKNIINILSGSDKRFPYQIEVLEDRTVLVANRFRLVDRTLSQATVGDTSCIFTQTNEDEPVLLKNGNTWSSCVLPTDPVDFDFPQNIRKMILRLIVPDFSPSTYTDNLYYTLDITTRIGLVKIILATVVFSPDELLSLAKPYSEAGYDYHQYIDVEILNPWELCYSDDFAKFRNECCFEETGTNNCGAILDVELNAVTEDNGIYVPTIDYTTGRNMLLMSERDSDYMTLQLHEDIPNKAFISQLEFNSVYDGDLKTYLRETYFLDAQYLIPELVVIDSDNVYKLVDLPEDYDMKVVQIFPGNSIHFDQNSDWVSGMTIVVTYRIFDSTGNEILDLKSNRLPLTISMFSYLTGDEITFDETMEITNLDIVNKIEKRIISVNRPDDYKSNIIRPVFYRAYNSEDIELYSTVTFNVGINLDEYKTKVSNFVLQIEGVSFHETGRVPGYVIFEVIGNQLPKENPNGVYYILGDNQVLVTTGKYFYTDFQVQ